MSAARARGEGKTPIRSIRAEDDLWGAFSEACGVADEDRSTVIREFLAWYAGLPGARMPRRPRRDRPQEQ